VATNDLQADYVVLGGGLAGGLTALALCQAGHGSRVLLVERDARLGGNHTWSFHDTDLSDEQRRLVSPLVSHRWPRHEVRFPERVRTINAGYATFTGEDLARVVTDRLRAAGGRVLLDAPVTMHAGALRFADGRALEGRVVLDARGPAPDEQSGSVAYQKFVGLEVELDADGPWTVPVVMDATVPQVGGYRFIYVLPFTRRRVLIEDTVYSDDARLDIADFEGRVWTYVRDHGATIERVVRREIGVLPLPLSLSSLPTVEATGVVPIGYRGGFFHPVTGYSLPLAARVATAVAAATAPAVVPQAVAAIARDLRGQRRFHRLLNRLLFQAMPPAARWHALDRFYRLPDATIARFYASRNTLWDRLRVLAGRPPRGVSLTRMFRTPTEET
jgi:lycopene beta-cyclase